MLTRHRIQRGLNGTYCWQLAPRHAHARCMFQCCTSTVSLQKCKQHVSILHSLVIFIFKKFSSKLQSCQPRKCQLSIIFEFIQETSVGFCLTGSFSAVTRNKSHLPKASLGTPSPFLMPNQQSY